MTYNRICLQSSNLDYKSKSSVQK